MMKSISRISIPLVALLLLVIFVLSCNTPSSTSGEKLSKSLTALSQSNWRLFSLNGQKVNVTDGTSIPTLAFDPQNMQVSGNSGCNSFTGGFTTDKETITLSNLASTRMMCPDMKMETAFLSTIANVNNYSIYEGRLVLNDASGKQLMSFDPLEK